MKRTSVPNRKKVQNKVENNVWIKKLPYQEEKKLKIKYNKLLKKTSVP